MLLVVFLASQVAFVVSDYFSYHLANSIVYPPFPTVILVSIIGVALRI
jgi:hypothetical protein